jgi:hypothetical protein
MQFIRLFLIKRQADKSQWINITLKRYEKLLDCLLGIATPQWMTVMVQLKEYIYNIAFLFDPLKPSGKYTHQML